MILGIDLGERTTGVATSEGEIATPYKTIVHKSQTDAVNKILQIIDEVGATKVILGYVEGKIRKLFENFSEKLQSKRGDIEIILVDETLTTGQAQETLIKLQLSQKRRKEKEHEVAAALILQSYLDDQENFSTRSSMDSTSR